MVGKGEGTVVQENPPSLLSTRRGNRIFFKGGVCRSLLPRPEGKGGGGEVVFLFPGFGFVFGGFWVFFFGVGGFDCLLMKGGKKARGEREFFFLPKKEKKDPSLEGGKGEKESLSFLLHQGEGRGGGG